MSAPSLFSSSRWRPLEQQQKCPGGSRQVALRLPRVASPGANVRTLRHPGSEIERNHGGGEETGEVAEGLGELTEEGKGVSTGRGRAHHGLMFLRG